MNRYCCRARYCTSSPLHVDISVCSKNVPLFLFLSHYECSSIFHIWLAVFLPASPLLWIEVSQGILWHHVVTYRSWYQYWFNLPMFLYCIELTLNSRQLQTRMIEVVLLKDWKIKLINTFHKVIIDEITDEKSTLISFSKSSKRKNLYDKFLKTNYYALMIIRFFLKAYFLSLQFRA